VALAAIRGDRTLAQLAEQRALLTHRAPPSGRTSAARGLNPSAVRRTAANRYDVHTSRPVRKRKLVDEMCSEWGVSIRRACRVFLVDTSTYHYKSRRPGQAGIEGRIKEICQTRALPISARPCSAAARGLAYQSEEDAADLGELGLQLRNKTPKRRVKAKLRGDRTPATRSNETWAMDFVHDQLATGRKLRVLTIVDTFSRFSPAVEPRFTFRGADVVEVLERVGREVGFPATIRVDQGTEFVSRDLDLWAYQRGVTLDFSRPGKPTDNAFIEAFMVDLGRSA
jgi:putative transposase